MCSIIIFICLTVFFLDLEQQMFSFYVKVSCYNTETKLKHSFILKIYLLLFFCFLMVKLLPISAFGK